MRRREIDAVVIHHRQSWQHANAWTGGGAHIL